MSRSTCIRGFAALALALPLAAEAHTPGAAGAGFLAGFAHPLGGADHLLAMAGLGLWAGLESRERASGLLLVFLAAMVAGAALAFVGVALPMVETGILASVVVFGGLLAMRARLPLPLATAVVGLFALAHGHAHGAALPSTAAPGGYAFGFVLAAASLTGVSALLATLLERPRHAWLARGGGIGIVAGGLGLLTGV